MQVTTVNTTAIASVSPRINAFLDTVVTADNVEALFAEASQGRATPLRAAEMPIALDALKPKGGLFESAALAIHFGYTLADNDLVVMSKNPLSVEFNCL